MSSNDFYLIHLYSLTRATVVIVTAGSYQFLPHSSQTGYVFTVNTDLNGAGAGPGIAVGVKTSALSSKMMSKPIKFY